MRNERLLLLTCLASPWLATSCVSYTPHMAQVTPDYQARVRAGGNLQNLSTEVGKSCQTTILMLFSFGDASAQTAVNYLLHEERKPLMYMTLDTQNTNYVLFGRQCTHAFGVFAPVPEMETSTAPRPVVQPSPAWSSPAPPAIRPASPVSADEIGLADIGDASARLVLAVGQECTVMMKDQSTLSGTIGGLNGTMLLLSQSGDRVVSVDLLTVDRIALK